eukprot:3496814-Ditylum_brightwellii.AAC.1
MCAPKSLCTDAGSSARLCLYVLASGVSCGPVPALTLLLLPSSAASGERSLLPEGARGGGP